MNNELDHLLEQEWAGALTETERARLAALCALDPATAQRVRAENQLTRMLAAHGPNRAPRNLAAAVLNQLEAPAARRPGTLLQWNWLTSPSLRWGMAAALMMLVVVEGRILYEGRDSLRGRMQAIHEQSVPAPAALQNFEPANADANRAAEPSASKETKPPLKQRAERQTAAQRAVPKPEPTPEPSPSASRAEPKPTPEPTAEPGQSAVHSAERAEPRPTPTPEPSPAAATPALTADALAAPAESAIPAAPAPATEISETPQVDETVAASAEPPTVRVKDGLLPQRAPAAALAALPEATAAAAEGPLRMEIDLAAQTSSNSARMPGVKSPATHLAQDMAGEMNILMGAGERRHGVAKAGVPNMSARALEPGLEVNTDDLEREVEIALAGAGGEIVRRDALDKEPGWRLQVRLNPTQLLNFQTALESLEIRGEAREDAPGQSHYRLHAGERLLDNPRQLPPLPAGRPVEMELVIRPR